MHYFPAEKLFFPYINHGSESYTEYHNDILVFIFDGATRTVLILSKNLTSE